MSIPLFDMAQHIESNRLIFEAAFNRVLDSTKLIMGSEVENFEVEFAEYLNINFCTSVANGTDALEIALRGLGATEGTKVGLAGNCGGYGRTAIELIGCLPIYVSIDPDNYLMSFLDLSEKIKSGKLDIVIVTHLYGYVYPNILELSALCKAYGVKLIEDCAQAHGATFGANKCGTFGDAGTFSFYPTKNLGALGDGGSVVCHEIEVANKIKFLRQYGWQEKYQVNYRYARNSRLDEIQAAFLRGMLPRLDSWNQKRIIIAQRYLSEVKNPKITLPNFNLNSYVGHIFPVFVLEAAKFQSFLGANGIDTAIHYPINDEAQFAWENKVEDSPVSYPVSLPISQYLKHEQATDIINALNDY
jgi:dTDP-4-amino-4,6-dideoxygalactose transaminase